MPTIAKEQLCASFLAKWPPDYASFHSANCSVQSLSSAGGDAMMSAPLRIEIGVVLFFGLIAVAVLHHRMMKKASRDVSIFSVQFQINALKTYEFYIGIIVTVLLVSIAFTTGFIR